MSKALFSARGRMRRRDWWLWMIGLGLAFVLAGTLIHTWFGISSFDEDVAQIGKRPLTPFDAWMIFTNTVAFWPYVCLTAKRWHDRNRPGWLAALIPGVGIPQFALDHFANRLDGFSWHVVLGAVNVTLTAIGALALVWIVIDCGILDGTQGANKYGASPKGVGAQPEDIF